MKILITGSTGFVGSALVPFLRSHGHQVTRLVRTKDKLSDDTVLWDPQSDLGSCSDLEGFDCVINLGGENIANGRWTEKKKRRIRESRVLTTQRLCRCLVQLQHPPKVLINASAMGFYGDRGDLLLTENDSSGTGFLADVCRDWEKATSTAQQKGITVACLRFGIILGADGGALSKMLTPFKLGLGGKLGSGAQYMSWVAIDDVLRVVLHVIQNGLRGPINVSSPNAVTNEEFTKTLGKVLNRPTLLSVPKFVLRVALGQIADEGLLSSTRMVPQRLINTGYFFQYPDLEECLREIIAEL